MKILRYFLAHLFVLLITLSAARAQWTDLATGPAFSSGASTPILLLDGRVLVQNYLGNDWKILTPDANGSYVNGTWSSGGNLPAGYAPLFYASGVLRDGRVVVCGGEYNVSGGTAVETNQCAIYTPATNSWASLAGPGWASIGDGMGTVLPNGSFMLHDLFSRRYAILNPTTLTWTNYDGTSQGKADSNSEEGWTLMPDGTLLCVDCSNGNQAEKYIIATNTWVSASSTVGTLPSNGGLSIVPENGPQILMPNGTVFVYGASGATSIYTPGALPTDPGSWAGGPTITLDGNLMTAFDAPGAILPNGRAIIAVNQLGFNTPAHFVEFDGANLAAVADPGGAASHKAFQYRMLLLPTGELLVTDASNTVRVYTAGAAVGDNAWRPVVDNYPANAISGRSYTLTGRQLTGLSEGTYYGDDVSNSTNYPIVRIRNNGSGHVFYCPTHDVSTRAIGTGSLAVTTAVDIPGAVESGASTLEVIANGIASAPMPINLNPLFPLTTASVSGTMGNNGWYVSDVTVSFTADDAQGDYKETHYRLDGGADTIGASLTVNTDANPHTVEFWSVDLAGHVEPHQFLSFKRDATKPTLTFGAGAPPANGFGWNNTSVDIAWSAADNLSGLATAASGVLHFTLEGAGQTQSVTVTDNAGNSRTFTSVAVNIDKTKPTTTDSEPAADGCSGWYHGAVPVTLSASDSLSGVQFTRYRIDGGAAQTYSAAFTVAGDGIHTVEYWSVDRADNEEVHHTITLKIDGTPPVVTAAADKTEIWPPNHKLVPVTVSGTMTDAVSGIDATTARYEVVDEYGKVQPSGIITVGASGAYRFTVNLEASRLGTDRDGRTYTIYVTVKDLACNETTVAVTVTVPHDQRP